VEKSERLTFPPRLEIRQKSPDFHIPTAPTATLTSQLPKRLHILEKVEALIATTQEAVRELETAVDRKSRQVAVEGRVEFRDGLDQAIAQLTTKRGRLEVFKRERERIKDDIQALLPTEAQNQARKEEQQRFAVLAEKRLHCDRRAHGLIAQLRQVLAERGELSAGMQKSAALFEMPVYGERLGPSALENLLRLLPEDVLAESERWHDLTFGGSRAGKAYVVCVPCLELPETFAHCGIYRFGDMVRLTDEDAAELLSSKSVMTEENWKAVVAAAKAKGNSISSEVDRMKWEGQQQLLAEKARAAHEAVWGKNNPSHPFPGDALAAQV